MSSLLPDHYLVLTPDGLPRFDDSLDLVTVLVDSLNHLTAPDGRRGLCDGDILVISSKAVAKAEGRVRPASIRGKLIEDESAELVAKSGETVITRNHHGLVLAAAGIDASNTEPDTVVLLPADPDDSAKRLRRELEERIGLRLGVIITDTLGRPWRLGLTDVAIGSAGVLSLEDHRGKTDSFGRQLEQTQIALADELAAAGDLLKSKSAGRPVAVIRGLGHLVGDIFDQNAQTLIRPISDDLFRLGTREAIAEGAKQATRMRRTVRSFSSENLKTESELTSILTDAVAAAMTAPAPHHTKPSRFVLVKPETKTRLLSVMESKWRQDLAEIDGLDASEIEKRITRGRLLHDAPILVVPCLCREGSHDYPDQRRQAAEYDMFTLSGGAAIENFLIQLTTHGLASAWVSSSIFCPDEVLAILNLPPHWQPLGVIAIGEPVEAPKSRVELPLDDFYLSR